MSSADFFKTETKRKFNFGEHIVFKDILFDNPDDEKSNFIPKLSFFNCQSITYNNLLLLLILFDQNFYLNLKFFPHNVLQAQWWRQNGNTVKSTKRVLSYSIYISQLSKSALLNLWVFVYPKKPLSVKFAISCTPFSWSLSPRSTPRLIITDLAVSFTAFLHLIIRSA